MINFAAPCLEKNQFQMTMNGGSGNRPISKEQLDDLIFGRRSTYPQQFSGEKIDEASILQLLAYADSAPNHKKTRPWRFTVFSGQSLSGLIDLMRVFANSAAGEGGLSPSKIASYEERKQKVSHIICITCHRDIKANLPEIEEIAATACAVENIYLALPHLGLAGYWGTGSVAFSDEIRNFLSLGPEDIFMGFFYLGKPGGDMPPRSVRKAIEEIVTWKR